MPKVEVTVTGVKDLQAQFKNTESKLVRNLQSALKVSASLSEKKMKQLTPIDTGNLHRSVEANYSNLKNFEVTIGPDINVAYYAPFVEYGHHTRAGNFIPGQYFIRRTVTAMTPIITNIMNEAVSKSLKP